MSIELLKELENKSANSHEDYERWRCALEDAWPKILAVVEAAEQHLDCDGTLTRQILRNAILELKKVES